MSVQSIHQFAEKVALVTDGASDVGRAVAIQLALQGAFVVVGFSAADERAKDSVAALKNLGTLAHAVQADCSTGEGVRVLVGAVENLFGRLDLLVNCVKSAGDSSFDKTSEAVWTETTNANLKAVFFVTQAAVKLMSARPKPKIVNVVFDPAANEKNMAFAAAQAGVVNLTQNLAAQLKPKFRVNVVSIVERKSAAVENLDSELFRAPGNFAADDAARAVLFLLSSEAAAINGQILKIE